MSDTNDVRPKDLGKIIEDRKLVQEIALSLLTLVRGRESSIALHPTEQRILMLCAGAVFSLWRAVPLVHISSQPIDHIVVSADYLEKIVRHNSITYSDDERSRAWSFGFYMSNARYRLKELCRDEILDAWPEASTAIAQLGLQHTVEARVKGYSAAQVLRDSITAVTAVVKVLDVRWISKFPLA